MSENERVKLTPKERMAVLAALGTWHEAVTSTAPSDKPAAEAAAMALYHLVNQRAPRIVWVSSPIDAAREAGADIITSIAPTLLRIAMSRLDHMPNRWQIPFAEIARGGDSEPLNAEDAFRAAMAIAGAEPFRTRFRRWVGSQIHSHVAGSLSMMPFLRRLRIQSMRGFLQGGAAPLLPALIDVSTSILKIPEAEELRPFVTLANACGYCLPCEDTCYLTERPEFIRTEGGDLHADEGPAVAWPGGAMPMWRWRGLPVAEHVVAPIAAMDARSIRRERSVILRDIMVERFGLERFIRECGARPVTNSARCGSQCTLFLDEG